MSRRTSLLLGAMLTGMVLVLAALPVPSQAAPVGKGDLVVTASDDAHVQSEAEVLLTPPAGTSLVAEDIQGDWVLVTVRKETQEVRGFVHVENLRRVAMLKHTDPRGFSFQYPESWKLASKDELAESARKAEQYTAKLPGVGPPPALKIVPIALKADSGESVNCVIIPGTPPEIDARMARQYAGFIQDGYTQMGVSVTNIRAETISLGGKKAISAHWDAAAKDAKEAVRQWQVAIAGKSRVYTFTCSALAPQFWRHEPLFRAIIQSIELQE